MGITRLTTRQRYIAQGLVNERFEITMALPDIEGVTIQAVRNGIMVPPERFIIDREADNIFVRFLDTRPGQLPSDPDVDAYLNDGDVVHLLRKTRIDQDIVYTQGSALHASDQVDALDKLTLINQELADQLDQRDDSPNFLQSFDEFPAPFQGRIFHLNTARGNFGAGVYLYNGTEWSGVGGGSGSGVITGDAFTQEAQSLGQLFYLTAEDEFLGTMRPPGLWVYSGTDWVIVSTGNLFSPENITMFKTLILPNITGHTIDVPSKILTLTRDTGGDLVIRFPDNLYSSDDIPTPEELRRFITLEDGRFLLTEFGEYIEGA